MKNKNCDVESDSYCELQAIDIYTSEGDGNEEMIIIENPMQGEWKISLSDMSEYKNVEFVIFSH